MDVKAIQRSSLKIFLNHGQAAEETARLITPRIQNTGTSEETGCDEERNNDRLIHLWAFIVDINQAAPSTTLLADVLE